MGEDALPRRLDADVAVVGAGPAGIAAAVAAAECGRRVVVLDDSMRPGGQIWRHSARGSVPSTGRRWLQRLDRSGARVVSGATVVDATPGFRLTVQVRGRPMAVDAGALVLATGARERFLPFPGWTLPNVVGVGGAQALLKSGASFAGRRVVIAGSGPLLLPVAAALASAGARVDLVAEQAPRSRVLAFALGLWRSPARIGQAARYRMGFRSAPYRLGCWISRASGDATVREATLTDGVRSWTVPCDVLCVGFGLVPNVELAQLLECSVEDGRVVVGREQQTSREGVYCAGEPTGIGGMEAAVVEGEIAGLAAAGRSTGAARHFARRDRARAFARRLDAAFMLRPELRSLADHGTVVCRCEDVPLGSLVSFQGSRHAKLHTRAGMGPCQGRVCGPAMQFVFGWQPDSVRVPVGSATVDTLMQAPSPHPHSPA